MLESAFGRPYALFLEYPSEYVHNKAVRLVHTLPTAAELTNRALAQFKKMSGSGEGEEMVFTKKFQYSTNATMYTKRIMKVIEYK